MDLKARLRNKAFWVGLVSGGIVLAQSLGYHVVPDQVNIIANALLGIGITLGVIVDTSTPGITDNKEI